MASFKNIIFNKPTGTLFGQKVTNFTGVNDSNNNREMLVTNGGVMVVSYIPTIGDCQADTRYGIGTPIRISPFNANLSKLFIKLRGKAMTLGNYTAADLGKALLALDSLYGLLSELDVDINALSAYNYDNVATRGMLQHILWQSPATAQMNIADIITRRNNIADKLKVLPFVPGIPFLQDHIDWARYIYKDDNLGKSSLILFRRAAFYRWATLTSDAHPGALYLCDVNSYTGHGRIGSDIIYAEQKFQILEKLINDYSLDDDFMNLCSGIAYAYGVDTEKYNIPKLPEDTTKFELEYKYDLDVIDSLRSADYHFLTSNDIAGIDEDTEGHLKYTTDFNGAPSGYFTISTLNSISGTNPVQYHGIDTGEGRVLFSYEDNPTPEAIDTIVRYVHDYAHVNATDTVSGVYGLKTEYLTGLKFWFLDDDMTFKYNSDDSFVHVGANTSIGSAKEVDIQGSFISRPIFYSLAFDGNGNYMGNAPIHFPKDIDNLGYLPRFANSSYSERYMWDKFFTSRGTSSRKPKKGQENIE